MNELTIEDANEIAIISMQHAKEKEMVILSTKQKLMALGFSPNEIAVIMGEQVIDNGYGML